MQNKPTSIEQRLAEVAKGFATPQTKGQQVLLNFAKQYSGVEECVAEKTRSWQRQTKRRISLHNPFIEEQVFVEKVQKMKFEDLKKDFQNLSKTYKAIPSVQKMPTTIEMDYYKKAFSAKTNMAQAIARNFAGDLEKSLIARQTDWEMQEIDKARKSFVDELFDNLEKLRRLMQIFKGVSDNLGRLWDLAQKDLMDNGFDVLEQYADLLEKDKGVAELIDMIGRYNQSEMEYHKELRDKMVIKHEVHTEPAYKGQISGLQVSDCIENSLPSELGLYSNPQTRPIFKLRFAQKQLLNYAYMRQVALQRQEIQQEEIKVGETQGKGPMLICVDTSGSMHGTPERVAKTVTYALAKKALLEKRKCYLISFSTGISVMNLSVLDSAAGLQQLVAFLRMSFNGGTDANPALCHAIEMLNTEKWKQADVLMVSDFIMDNLSKTVVEGIELQRKNKCKFYSLAVTSQANENQLKCFDCNWIYDTNKTDSVRQLVKQLSSL